MTVRGGTGTLYGPMLGAAVFEIVSEELSSVFPWWRFVLGVFFVLVVLFLPQGIVSLPAKVNELAGDDGIDITLSDGPEVEK
jgi:branched-chain amino acid transport system permease protein